MNEISEFTQKLSALFIFILIIAGNFLGTLFPCRIQKNLRYNIWMKHILGLFTMAFLSVVAFQDTVFSLDFKSLVTYTVVLYSYFLVLSKTPAYIWISIFVLISMVYTYQLKKTQIDEDQTKTPSTDKDKGKMDTIFTITGSIILILTFFGFFTYMGEKKFEYKKRFSYIKFIFGNTPCKGKMTKTTLLNSLKHVLD